MIHYENRAVFIHIPRTSGISLSLAVMRQPDPENTSPNVILGCDRRGLWRHSRAHDMRNILPDWSVLKKFTIIRNPWRICESTYKQFHMALARVNQGARHAFPSLEQALREACSKPFGEFVRWHYAFLENGFYDHWAMAHGRDLGVEAFPFESLDDHWPRICELMEIPGTRRPYENPSPPRETAWTDSAIDFIRSRCGLDFERFGYPRQP